MNIWTHEEEAVKLWLEHYDQCVEELEITRDSQERRWAEEAFREVIQVKLLDCGSVKVKWEHGCWWADCKHPVFHGQYYCVMAHPNFTSWKEPFDLAQRLQEGEE